MKAWNPIHPATAPQTPGDTTGPSGAAREIFEWLEVIVLCLVSVILISTVLIRPAGVVGQSMEPTLYNGDRLLVTSFFYQPKAGDIVVISQQDDVQEHLVKRVIATEGQTVDIDFEKGEVYVDGVLLQEDYIKEKTYRQFPGSSGITFPATVPEGHVFVLGDNRNESKDSRHSDIGMVDTKYILGKVVFRIYPFNRIGAL